MAQARGRAFWLEFFQGHAKSGMSLKDYCAQKKASYKTALNWSSKLRPELEAGKNQKAKTGISGRSKKQGYRDQNRDNGDNRDKAKGRTKSKSAGKKADNTSGCGQENPSPSEKKEFKAHPNSLANLLPTQIKKGEQRALKHGGYAHYFPPELVRQSSDLPASRRLDALIELSDLRLRNVLAKRAEWEAKHEYGEISDKDYDLDEITDKTGFGESGSSERSEKRVRPNFEGMIDTLTGRIGWLVAERHRIERQLEITATEAADNRRAIINRGEAEGWSAAEIGLEIEKHGLQVPSTLQQQIRAELALIEPEEPEGGLSDDELEALSAEYEKEVKSEAQWMEDRKKVVAEIVSSGSDYKKIDGQSDGEAQEVDSPRQEMD